MNEEDYEDAKWDEREVEPDELFFYFIIGGAIPFTLFIIYCCLMPV